MPLYLRRSLTLILFTVPAAAGMLPLRIPFQGKLVDPTTNAPRNGSISMQFRLYDAPTGGSALFTETQAVAVNNGVFSVQIGTTSRLDADLFSGASAYLGITVESDSEMLPRQPLSMTPYAFTAMQLVNDGDIRVNAGTAYSTFTSAGNLLLPHGVTAATASFTAAGATVFSLQTSSGVNVLGGTLRLSPSSRGLDATGTGITASTGAFLGYLDAAGAAAPAVSGAGALRIYYDSTREQWLASAGGRAFSPVGTMSTTLWNTNSVAGVINQGNNIPAALAEFNAAIQGTRMNIDCDDLPARLALRYNLRAITGTPLTIILSVRDTSNTANVLVTASQATTGAGTSYQGQSAFTAKPGWCTGTQTVAIYTSGGNGGADFILPHLLLMGQP
ncbi:MAG: hypothetical protein Q8T11_14270 [Elusimicrobiota bacterium]|nr:hypothetical protein [Elusimicrobiota bacterium]